MTHTDEVCETVHNGQRVAWVLYQIDHSLSENAQIGTEVLPCLDLLVDLMKQVRK